MQENTSAKLGLWICLPLLAWGAVWFAALSMPVSDCDGYGSDSGEQEVMLVVLVAAASLCTAGAALWRLVGLSRANAFSARRDLTIGGSVVVALVLAAVASAPRARIEIIPVTGLLLTGLALLALLIAWAAGVRADQVGLLLPLYLLGAALLAYPLVGLLALAGSSGTFC
jgi:hypothetical protein